MGLRNVTSLFAKLSQPLVEFMKHIALWMLAMMMFLTFADVLLRYVFNSPVPGATELIEFMMGIVVTFSVAYTAYKKSHIGVDLVIDRFPKKTRKLVACCASFLSFGLFALICWQTILLIFEDYHSNLTSAVLYLPVYPFTAAVALGLVILCLVLLVEFLSLLGEVVWEWTRS
jgi:TRAP-type C4-dicarboxylate transport system permease small subunit